MKLNRQGQEWRMSDMSKIDLKDIIFVILISIAAALGVLGLWMVFTLLVAILGIVLMFICLCFVAMVIFYQLVKD